MADFWRIIEHYKVTGFSGVPTVYSALPPVPQDADISSLRAAAVGAAPLPSRVRERFESAVKVPLLEGYELTEATCASAATPVLAPRAGSVGLRLPYQRIKAITVDADETPVGDCQPGDTGVLAISGPAVFPGYLRPAEGGHVPDPAVRSSTAGSRRSRDSTTNAATRPSGRPTVVLPAARPTAIRRRSGRPGPGSVSPPSRRMSLPSR